MLSQLALLLLVGTIRLVDVTFITERISPPFQSLIFCPSHF